MAGSSRVFSKAAFRPWLGPRNQARRLSPDGSGRPYRRRPPALNPLR